MKEGPEYARYGMKLWRGDGQGAMPTLPTHTQFQTIKLLIGELILSTALYIKNDAMTMKSRLGDRPAWTGRFNRHFTLLVWGVKCIDHNQWDLLFDDYDDCMDNSRNEYYGRGFNDIPWKLLRVYKEDAQNQYDLFIVKKKNAQREEQRKNESRVINILSQKQAKSRSKALEKERSKKWNLVSVTNQAPSHRLRGPKAQRVKGMHAVYDVSKAHRNDMYATSTVTNTNYQSMDQTNTNQSMDVRSESSDYNMMGVYFGRANDKE